MNHKVKNYGLTPVTRPKITAEKKLDLRGEDGRRIIYTETKKVLKTHAKTFKKLADM